MITINRIEFDGMQLHALGVFPDTDDARTAVAAIHVATIYMARSATSAAVGAVIAYRATSCGQTTSTEETTATGPAAPLGSINCPHAARITCGIDVAICGRPSSAGESKSRVTWCITVKATARCYGCAANCKRGGIAIGGRRCNAARANGVTIGRAGADREQLGTVRSRTTATASARTSGPVVGHRAAIATTADALDID